MQFLPLKLDADDHKCWIFEWIRLKFSHVRLLLLTYRECREQWWYQLPCKMADSRRRHPFCRLSTVRSPPTIPRSGYSNISDLPCHSESMAMCVASSGSCNCIPSSVCPCDTAPNRHCSCNNGARQECSHRWSDSFAAPHWRHALMDRSRYF